MRGYSVASQRCVLGSIGRDCSGYLDRYLEQCAALAELVPLDVKIVIGDSTDDSLHKAVSASVKFPLTVTEFNHGGPRFGSIVDQRRWWQISLCCNRVLEQVSKEADWFIWVEMDLIWCASTMVELLRALNSQRRVIAPLALQTGDVFYDIWGFRKDGEHFSQFYPYCRDWDSAPRYLEIDSAGSCLVMDADIARSTRFSEGLEGNEGIVGWCREIRKIAKIWLDKRSVVIHP